MSLNDRYFVFDFKVALKEGHFMLLNIISEEMIEIEKNFLSINHLGLFYHFSHDEREMKILYFSYQNSTMKMLD